MQPFITVGISVFAWSLNFGRAQPALDDINPSSTDSVSAANSSITLDPVTVGATNVQGIIAGPHFQENNILPAPTSVALAAGRIQCKETCLHQMKGDGWCNTECAEADCDFDNGDCEGWCAPDCKKEWLGDKWCDKDCFREECQWDQGDCDDVFKHGEVLFPLGVHEEFDYSNCACEKKFIHNGRCDAECNTKECNWDGNDCRRYCAPGCLNAWQGDTECDTVCFNEACGYDKGDCEECSPGCRPDRIGNGICDGACMTDACHWDMGDCAGVCKVYPVDYDNLPFEYNQCRTEWEGDGFCDCFCLNTSCHMDKGDCKGQEDECAVKIARAENRSGGVFPTPIPGSEADLISTTSKPAPTRIAQESAIFPP
eukprot:Gregarina_sp_Poly_1__9148@NODE_561_length_7528_cov_34_720949_g441_i0_p4_GENE_NODE_561_length_7528_cov_34_720949_g441_i0NODE_561_length_7528_cov_34_720949_g441_i0_p4_ORF_typecomplete_len370_score26_28Notch/PF00066_17/2_2e06Notch/PF00066_17/2e07Notch/PF00066_17/4_1e09Notch/PF00066_17/3e08Notch/PF00066_17/5_3e08Notch/PF00066_17/0_0012_NODE_561_length_7528_cov_34_720949_g441_i032944403